MDKRLKPALFLFVAFVVSDFPLGYLRHRSLPEGIISIFGGLLSTAFFLGWFWWRGKQD
jgi:hypothetical protein